MKTVAYYRVSTDEQGASGLGIEAQRQAIETMAATKGWHIRSSHIEVESGKNNDRPMLARAIAECRNIGATLVVAKLDRLSRDASFLLSLFDGNVPIVFGDMPELDASTSAGRLQLVVLAGFAEFERKRISERTKAALAASTKKLGGARGDAGARGVKYGLPKAIEARRAKAAETAARLFEVICQAEADGCETNYQVAMRLNELGVSTPSGNGKWGVATVARVKEKANAGE